MPLRTAVALALAFAACNAFSQTWPSRPIRIIVGATAGVPSDSLSRGMAEALSRSLAQPVIVENRVGADGVIGVDACAKATPDGHNLCVTTNGTIIWHRVLRAKLPYDPVRDLVPIAQGGFFDSALVAHPSVPANNVQELVELARANPDKLNWAHFGPQSTGFLYASWLKRGRDAPFYLVPYKSQQQMLQALMVNESNAGVFGISNATSQLKSGKLKALAVTSSKRIDWMSNVPTFEEAGIKLPLRAWFGFHAPSAMPADIVGRLHGEMRKVLDDSHFRSTVMQKLALSEGIASREEFDAYIRAQLKAAHELATYIGLKPE